MLLFQTKVHIIQLIGGIKLFDTVLLKLQHASLFTDSLQFGFNPTHLQ